ncbi:MAG: hypothetical protein QNJ94_11025 [Alphaproteobacteria bacterium]|nr:hypothetical protein [Alphaproteobacteria bacterium]
MRTALLAIFFGALLTVAVSGTIYFWLKYNDVELSGHGFAALILGVVVSIGLGVGLMRLVYLSDRKGFD